MKNSVGLGMSFADYVGAAVVVHLARSGWSRTDAGNFKWKGALAVCIPLKMLDFTKKLILHQE